MNSEVPPPNDEIIISNFELNEFMLEQVYRPIKILYTVFACVLGILGTVGLFLNIVSLLCGTVPGIASFAVFVICIGTGILICTQYSTNFFRYEIIRMVNKIGDVYEVYIGDNKALNMLFIGANGFSSREDEDKFRARLTAVVGEKKFIVRK